jgi:2-phosphosulfolactate phosphatase
MKERRIKKILEAQSDPNKPALLLARRVGQNARLNDTRKWVAVCMTPALIDQFEISNAIVVVIDILRATTSMCVAFDQGAKSIIPVATIEECLEWKNKGFLAAAERQGVQQAGFDFGNSPFSFMIPKVKGADIAMTTTNGTQAIHQARLRNAKDIVIGAFSNISVLTDYLKERNENVVFLCSGWQDKPNLEDTIFAGAMIWNLRKHFDLFEDTALISEALYRMANRRKRYFMESSSHFHRITMQLRIVKDVKYSLRRDTHDVLPALRGDRLVNILKG